MLLLDGKVMLTTREVADALGVTPGRVRNFVLANRIRSLKIGQDLLIPETELVKLSNRRPGRPSKKKRKPVEKRTGPRNSLKLPVRPEFLS